jgi:MerR family transcriptional regulator, light-induced transcriptional regulator
VVELRERYVEALVDGDPATAAALVHAATSDGIDVRSLYLQVLQPALYEIGRRWEEAEISIAQEHLATATTQSLMARLAERLEHTTPRGRTALVAGAEGELHALAEMAADRGVDVVALSASLNERLPEVIAAVRALGALEPRPLIAVGGQAFAGDPTVALATGADLYANNAEALVGTLAERF